MAELQTKEAIMERITALQHDLDTLVMSAEKEYRTRFEVSDLKYTLLKMEINELRQTVEQTVGVQKEQARMHERVPETRSEREAQRRQRQKRINEIQKQIEHLKFKLQTEVYTTQKEMELIDKIKQLNCKIEEIEGEDPAYAYYRKNSW